MRQPPKTGLYTATKINPGKQFLVEDVFIDDEEDADGDFFLVNLIEASDAGDMSAIGMELAPGEWFAMVEEYGLTEVAQEDS